MPKILSSTAQRQSSASSIDGSDSALSISTDDSNFEKPCAIKVIVRARPLNERELLAKTPVIVSASQSSIQVVNPVVFLDPAYLEAISTPTKRATAGDLPISLTSQGIAAATVVGECRTFHFDRCFGGDINATNDSGPNSTVSTDIDITTQKPNQELIFEEIGHDMIESAFQGFNCTVLAYGQTGSGKTHTMVGDKTDSGKGIIPRVCEALFMGIDARRAKENESIEAASSNEEEDRNIRRTIYSTHVSYCEIYKEKVNDLLDPSSSGASDSNTLSRRPSTPGSTQPKSPTAISTDEGFGSSPSSRRTLRVREHPLSGPFVEGLTVRSVTSYADIAEEMLAGDKLRTVASTLMNPVSSRSHAVFTITLTQTTFDPVSQCATDKTSKICMIDLAGSERANISGTSGDRLKEGAMINKSLTTLGRVISALSKQTNDRVPYRDSTLTWLLKESLGGNAKTTMLAMVSPSSDNYDETMSTLRYAESAKKVMNRAVINEDTNARIIRQLRQEIQELRAELAKGKHSPRDSNAGISASLAEREDFYAELQQEVEFFRSQQQMLMDASYGQTVCTQSPSGAVFLATNGPSLVNMNRNLQVGEALAYPLVEGTTVLGSGSDLEKRTKEGDANQSSKGKREVSPSKKNAWSPTLRKQKSSSSSSPRWHGVETLTTDHSNLAEENKNTQFYQLGSADPTDILSRHVQLACKRKLPLDGNNELESDKGGFRIKIEPLDANARVLVNDHPIPFENHESVQLAHGDHIQVGRSYCFRLHVPHEAASGERSNHSLCSEDTSASSKLNEETDENTKMTGLSDIATHTPDNISDVDALVNEANVISDRLHLHTEFTVKSGDDTVNNAETTILVKKQLDEGQYRIVEWKRPMLEAKVKFLREFAHSLETNGTLITDELNAEEGTVHSAVESPDKLSQPRPADVLLDEQTLLRVEDSLPRSSSSCESAPQASLGHVDEKPSTCIRLLGHGRVFLECLQPGFAGPLYAAIYDCTGNSIGKVELRLESSPVPKTKKQTNFLTMFSQHKQSATSKVSVHIERVEFTMSTVLASQGISLTLKKWGGGESSKHEGEDDLTAFSTPKVPPLNSDVIKGTCSSDSWKTFLLHQVFETTASSFSMKMPKIKEEAFMNNHDFIAIEVWGYGQALLSQRMLTLDQTVMKAEPHPSISRKMDFYVSIDVEERAHDGLFSSVAIKSDGTLRLHVNRPRRLNVRVTQSDQQLFALKQIDGVRISTAFPINGSIANLSPDGDKSLQRLLSPSSSKTVLYEEHNKKQSRYVTETPWQTLDFRGECEVDANGRFLNAIVRWDKDPQVQETVNKHYKRSVFRVVVAFTTTWSMVPIVICKSMVVKMCPNVVSASKKISRGIEASRSVWWARESFSRSYRLGTWYTADVSIGACFHDNNSGDKKTDIDVPSSDSQTQAINAIVEDYIGGLARLESAFTLERIRQQILIMMSHREKNQQQDSEDLSAAGITLDAEDATACLNKLFEIGDDEEQVYEFVQLQYNQMFLRHKANKNLLVGLMNGNVIDLTPPRSHIPSLELNENDIAMNPLPPTPERHSIHFVSEPSHLAGDSGEDMSGFLMFSISSQLDEASAAAIAPLSSTTTTKLANKNTTTKEKVSWERRWFVLKRPFLYAYKSFAQKEQIGVLDISKSQLLVESSSSADSIAKTASLSHQQRRASMPVATSSSMGSRSRHDQRRASTSPIPFAFKLVCLAGHKCVVWSLQTSTAAEMRAWLVAIDPLKIEAREAIVSNNQQNIETPVITA